MFEEHYRGTVAEAMNYFTEKKPKGEFVLVLAGA
jgi:16S rRNA (cytidine1402-2'-O)-methyltransferase